MLQRCFQTNLKSKTSKRTRSKRHTSSLCLTDCCAADCTFVGSFARVLADSNPNTPTQPKKKTHNRNEHFARKTQQQINGRSERACKTKGTPQMRFGGSPVRQLKKRQFSR